MKKMKRFAMIMLLCVWAVQGLCFPDTAAFAAGMTAPHYPETGSRVKTSDRLTVDYSHMDQGYVMVKAGKTDKRVQLTVKKGPDSVHYEINGVGQYEIIPLQFGNGEYRFSLVIATDQGGNRGRNAGTVRLQCRMADEFSCFLYPNQYVNYDADSPVVKKAQDLCRGLTEPRDIKKAICDYVTGHYSYDWIKNGTVRSGKIMNKLPDIMTTWETSTGICGDLSALTCAMLRSQGVPARLVIGTADGSCHAWVSIIIDGKDNSYDPVAEITSVTVQKYQAERYY